MAKRKSKKKAKKKIAKKLKRKKAVVLKADVETLIEAARRILANHVCSYCGSAERVIYRTVADFPYCHKCQARDDMRKRRKTKKWNGLRGAE